MPDGNGLDILKEIKAGNPNAAVHHDDGLHLDQVGDRGHAARRLRLHLESPSTSKS